MNRLGFLLLCLLFAGITIAEQTEAEKDPPNYWEDLNAVINQMHLKYRVFTRNLKKPIEELSTEKLQKDHYQVCSSGEEAIQFIQFFDATFVEGVVTELVNLGFPARSDDMDLYPEDFQENLLSLYHEILGSDELIQAFVSYLSDILLFTEYLTTEEFITMVILKIIPSSHRSAHSGRL